MRSKEIFYSSGTKLQIINNTPVEGFGKFVYKMTDGINTVAAKILKDENLAYSVSLNVREEMVANRLLRRTPLREYIPEYLYPLVDANRHTIGLAVKWEDGIKVSELGSESSLSAMDVDRFEEAALSAIAMRIPPSHESLKPYNVLFNPQRTPPLWIAEYNLERVETDVHMRFYQTEFADAMERLRERIHT